MHLDDADLRCRRGRPARRLERPHRLARPHIDPDEAAALGRRIGLVADLVAHPCAIVGLARHIDDPAFDVEFPAVIEAAQPAFLVAAESERGLAMGTMLAEDAKAPLAV